jgi:segregation and condensation protein B
VSDSEVSVDIETRRAVEAIVLAATEPVHPTVMAQLLEVSVEVIDDLCAALAAEYEAQGRGFQLARVAGGYRFQTHPDAYAYVERFVLDGQTARLSGPALETLAIIAYKQPVSRAQLSAIRGVNVDATLKTLVARGYVDEIGHDPTPGNPSMFATVPRTPRTELARRPARARRLRAGGVGGGGAGARPVAVDERRAGDRSRHRRRARCRGRRHERAVARWRPTASGCRRCSRARASDPGAPTRR